MALVSPFAGKSTLVASGTAPSDVFAKDERRARKREARRLRCQESRLRREARQLRR